MSAVILAFPSRGSTVAERVRARLPGFAKCIVRYAEVYAESYQRKTQCSDSDAVSAGVRCAKQQGGQPPLGAA